MGPQEKKETASYMLAGLMQTMIDMLHDGISLAPQVLKYRALEGYSIPNSRSLLARVYSAMRPETRRRWL